MYAMHSSYCVVSHCKSFEWTHSASPIEGPGLDHQGSVAVAHFEAGKVQNSQDCDSRSRELYFADSEAS
eukprot:9491947-Pyramimonas_sp.AAC.2